MSKSKREILPKEADAPLRRFRLLRDRQGRLRTIWLLLISLLSRAVVALTFRYGLVRAMGSLFSAWGIDADTAHLAPTWAQILYSWHATAANALFSAALLCLCRSLRRLWGNTSAQPARCGRTFVTSALTGAIAALLAAAACLIPDSDRLEWPLNAPRLSWTTALLCALSLFAIIAEETFTKRVLQDGLAKRRGEKIAMAVVCAVFWGLERGWTVGWVGAVNTLLLGAVGCLMYRSCGLWACIGFRWGWTFVNGTLLGVGGSASVYRLYGVSETLLTGGDAGPMAGLWATLALCAMCAVLWIPAKSRPLDARSA